MPEFSSWRSYWDFEHVVKRQSRYVLPPEVQTFREAVLATADKRAQNILAQVHLWRAQRGSAWRFDKEHGVEIEIAHPPDRMKPRRESAPEGRVNPKGIPCLYLATVRDTALAEVRPWVGEPVSAGQFEILRDLRVVNCTTKQTGTTLYLEEGEPSPAEREESVWNHIDRAFAKPVTRNDDVADYVPTQILAEWFKANGFDGVAYRSALGPGLNIALFDLEAATLRNCSVFEMGAYPAVEFKETTNAYYVPR